MEEKQKLTLWHMLDRMREMEDLADDNADLSEFVGELADKVDAIKSYIDTLEAESEKFKRYAVEMKKRSDTITKAKERLETYVIQSLEEHGTTFEVGNMWSVKIRESEKVQIDVEAEQALKEDTLFFDMIAVGAIKHTESWSWDKKVCKDLIKTGQFKSYGRVEKTKSLNFTAKKGTK